MYKWFVVLAICILAAQASAEESQLLKTEKEKVSYGIGVDVGRNFKKLGINIDMDILLNGLKDGYSGNKIMMDEKDLRETMNTYQSDLLKKQAQSRIATAEKNKKSGEAFLSDNKNKEEVVTLPSGLQYKILKAGDGKKPASSDTVECNYRGTLINGTEFDSSYNRGQSATFKVNGVIPGWTEALQLMPTGSKWLLFVPSQLAYGERGAGRDIGPNETLIFEVELIAIK
ncbi:MAG: FKBP-type peptidyl-prolyl cis-trans isomerase [Candidatus Schekmanbacteria bacterium]|nr:FKBP-type peptidyl-prolyl cis-trans isomerase [Candidatus Schekmanbacteria bacterium]